MNSRKKKSLTLNRLLVLTILFLGVGIGAWHLFLRPAHTSITLQPLPEGFYSHGIDISHHQGEIDWETFFSKMDTTISFVYCKVTEGAHFVDEQWERNHRHLEKYGMKHGAYHFFTPDISARLQVDHFLNYYMPSRDDLPPVLDAEVEASTDARLIDGMKEWLTAVEEETGERPIIYTSYTMYRDKMKGKFPGYDFWIASYNLTEARMGSPEIIHWQYSDRGCVPGMKGFVDLNFSKKKFGVQLDRAQ